MNKINDKFKPTDEVVDFLKKKALKPGFSWLDVWAQEHAHNFTVAKAIELELLTTFKKSLEDAIQNGQGFATWQQEIKTRLAKSGWLTPRTVTDPTGIEPPKTVYFGSPRRLRTIYWGNMSSARAAGQWQRAQKSKAFLPYFLYLRTTAADPRQEHLQWVGVILPVDDPFWSTHFPPNGWMCQCNVIQITAKDAERRLQNSGGGNITYTGQRPEIETRPFTNKRTGKVSDIPIGIDPGWHTNPGLSRSRNLIDHLEERLETSNPKDATKSLTSLWNDPFVKAAQHLPGSTFIPAGRREGLTAIFDGRTVTSPLVSISTTTLNERIEKHKLDIADFHLLPLIIENATILPDEKGDPNVKTLIARFGKTWWRVFIKLSANGYLRVNSFHQRDRNLIERVLKANGMRLEDVKNLED